MQDRKARIGCVMEAKNIIEEKMKQIVEWAESRDNVIRYQRVVDIL